MKNLVAMSMEEASACIAKVASEHDTASCDGHRFYTCDDGAEELVHSDPDEAIEDFLQGLWKLGDSEEEFRARLPKTVTVYEYKHMELVRPSPEEVLETVLGPIDEEYGNPNGDGYELTPRLIAAAKNLCDAIKDEYTPWACDRVGSYEVNVKEWLTANPDLFADLFA